MREEWIEVDIYLNNYIMSRIVLYEAIRPLVLSIKEEHNIHSWHFFLEPEICLRFLADKTSIKKIKKQLDDGLTYLEDEIPELFFRHIFGSHGKKGKHFLGETDYYGAFWELQYKSWEADANLALKLSQPLNTKNVIEFHARRRVHLTLNQFGYTRFQEVQFHVKQAYRNFSLFLRGL